MYAEFEYTVRDCKIGCVVVAGGVIMVLGSGGPWGPYLLKGWARGVGRRRNCGEVLKWWGPEGTIFFERMGAWCWPEVELWCGAEVVGARGNHNY